MLVETDRRKWNQDPSIVLVVWPSGDLNDIEWFTCNVQLYIIH